MAQEGFIEWIKLCREMAQKAEGESLNLSFAKHLNPDEEKMIDYYIKYDTINNSKKLTYWTWILAIATWVLAIATIILVFVTK